MATLTSRLTLKELAELYSVRAIADVPFPPPGVPFDEGDEDAIASRLRLISYEVPSEEWRAIDCHGTPVDAPRRFIDGSVFTRQAIAFKVDGQPRPGVLACVGAMALDLHGRQLTRVPGSLSVDTVLSFHSTGMAPDHVRQLESEVQALGIRLLFPEIDASNDYDRLARRARDRAVEEMEKAEQAVLRRDPTVPAVVDGLLERRLVRHEQHSSPVVGVVKSHSRQYLPSAHLGFIYGLRACQRTPAFEIDASHAVLVSWYLRLSPANNLPPSGGIVRVALAKEYLESRFPDRTERSAHISALSSWLFTMRHREQSYARAAVSLEPIVRIEDELHAVLPPLAAQAARLQRALGV